MARLESAAMLRCARSLRLLPSSLDPKVAARKLRDAAPPPSGYYPWNDPLLGDDDSADAPRPRVAPSNECPVCADRQLLRSRLGQGYLASRWRDRFPQRFSL